MIPGAAASWATAPTNTPAEEREAQGGQRRPTGQPASGMGLKRYRAQPSNSLLELLLA